MKLISERRGNCKAKPLSLSLSLSTKKRISRTGLFAVSLAILVAGVAGVVNFTKDARAVASYQFENVGTLTKFVVKNAVGTVLDEEHGVGFASSLQVSYALEGEIGATTLAELQMGDQVVITMNYDSNSTYAMYPSSFSPDLIDAGGTKQFDVSITSSQIILTKTAAPISNEFTFTLNSTAQSKAYIPANWENLSTEVWIHGFENLAVSFPNSAKASNSQNQLCVDLQRSTSGTGNIIMRQVSYLLRVYNDLLAGKDIATLYADLATTDQILIYRLEPNNQISNLAVQNLAHMAFDMMPDGKTLNGSFYSNSSGIQHDVAQVSIPRDASDSVIFAAMTVSGKGTYGIVKDTDGGYVVAMNYGKLLGDTLMIYNTNDIASAATMPNTAANNQILANLIQQAIDKHLAAMRFYTDFRVNFYDPNVANTANFSLASNVLPVCDNAAESATSQVVQNTAEGSAQIVAHYVDMKGDPIASPSYSYGYNVAEKPADYDGATSAKVTPATVAGYSLVTDEAKLSSVATNAGITDNGNTVRVLSVAATLDFPEVKVGTVIDVYYFYALAHTVTFDNNCENDSSCSESPADQIVGDGGSATNPTPPIRNDCDFEYYYICSDQTQTKYDFTAPVTGELEMCAKWTAREEPSTPVAPVIPGVPNTGYQVKNG